MLDLMKKLKFGPANTSVLLPKLGWISFSVSFLMLSKGQQIYTTWTLLTDGKQTLLKDYVTAESWGGT